ncbi:MAG: hypothetical protein K9I95_01530 [Flavobacteriaceae bacterium]|nr:hypothetical protein [Flavobacteriaceae bacterium]
MNHNTDKQIEKLVDKIMKETSLGSPSFNFTDMVMAQVLEVKTSQVTVYKPLISKWIWYVIFTIMIGLIVYLTFNDSKPASIGWFDKLNLNTLPSLNFSKAIENVHFSKTSVYACVLLTVMLFIQIPILKHYLNKKLEV